MELPIEKREKYYEEVDFCEKQKARSITAAKGQFQSLHKAILAIVCIACASAFVSADFQVCTYGIHTDRV